ncbi:hypothetical protein JXJ21_13125 [candidate division KSB1 bacterium]|nr:hypothetical protein [candidate division KSB1 bacterium]
MRGLFAKILLSAILIGGLSGCNLFGVKGIQDRYDIEELTVDSVELPDSVKIGDKINLSVRGPLPDVSWAFDHFELTRDDTRITVRVFGRKDTDVEVVIMLLAVYEETFEVSIDEPGNYYFHFPGGGDSRKTENVFNGSIDKWVTVLP